VFGTGHSRSFAMEIAGRGGGLVPANKISIPDLAFYGDRTTADVMDPHLERDPSLAASLLGWRASVDLAEGLARTWAALS